MPNEEYLRYLQSPEWQEKRLQVLQRDKYRCVDCGARKRLEVHHTSYKRVFKEDLDDLITLCRACHEEEHSPKTQTVYVKASKLPKRINFAKPEPVLPSEPEPIRKPKPKVLKIKPDSVLTYEGRLNWMRKGEST